MNGAYDEHVTGAARERLIAYAVDEGDLALAVELYAGFLPFRDGYSVDAADIIAKAATPDNVATIRTAVELLITADPSHLRVSDLAAFYAEVAEGAGAPNAAPIELNEEIEHEEALRYAELIESWRFTRPIASSDSRWTTDVHYAEARSALNSGDTVQFAPENQLSMLNLATLFGNEEPSHASHFVFGETIVESTKNERVTMHIGGNVVPNVWVNGVEIQAIGTNAPYPDQSRFDVDLVAGANSIVVRLTTGSQGMNPLQQNTMYMAYGAFYPGQYMFTRRVFSSNPNTLQAGLRAESIKSPPPQFGLGILGRLESEAVGAGN